MDFELSDEQREFQDAARAFAAGELATHAAHWDAESIFPVETIAKAGEMGFCGLYTPQRWGGLGLSRQDAAIVFEELAGGCTSTTAYITIHNMATWMLARGGQEALCDEWVPALAAGQKLASYCLTEPQSGSDAASLRTRAVRDGDHYVLDGTKAFISGAGQTQAAHDLCSGIPAEMQQDFVAPKCGHYGIFSGRRWREIICPKIGEFIQKHG